MRMRQVILKRTIIGLLAMLFIAGAATRGDVAAAPVVKNCNPVSFLESVWKDLLGRAITPGEKAQLLNFLDTGGARTQVAQIVLNSAEYRTKLAQSLYLQLLGRAAGQAEVNSILIAMQSGATVEQIIALIVSSNEYYQNRGGGTINGFLGRLFIDLLGRSIDAGGLALFTDFLSRGGARPQVALSILGSSEYRAIQLHGFFNTFLMRGAGDSEINILLALWRQGARREQIMAQIVGSPEYCELARRPSRGHQQLIER